MSKATKDKEKKTVTQPIDSAKLNKNIDSAVTFLNSKNVSKLLTSLVNDLSKDNGKTQKGTILNFITNNLSTKSITLGLKIATTEPLQLINMYSLYKNYKAHPENKETIVKGIIDNDKSWGLIKGAAKHIPKISKILNNPFIAKKLPKNLEKYKIASLLNDRNSKKLTSSLQTDDTMNYFKSFAQNIAGDKTLLNKIINPPSKEEAEKLKNPADLSLKPEDLIKHLPKDVLSNGQNRVDHLSNFLKDNKNLIKEATQLPEVKKGFKTALNTELTELKNVEKLAYLTKYPNELSAVLSGISNKNRNQYLKNLINIVGQDDNMQEFVAANSDLITDIIVKDALDPNSKKFISGAIKVAIKNNKIYDNINNIIDIVTLDQGKTNRELAIGRVIEYLKITEKEPKLKEYLHENKEDFQNLLISVIEDQVNLGATANNFIADILAERVENPKQMIEFLEGLNAAKNKKSYMQTYVTQSVLGVMPQSFGEATAMPLGVIKNTAKGIYQGASKAVKAYNKSSSLESVRGNILKELPKKLQIHSQNQNPNAANDQKTDINIFS